MRYILIILVSSMIWGCGQDEKKTIGSGNKKFVSKESQSGRISDDITYDDSLANQEEENKSSDATEAPGSEAPGSEAPGSETEKPDENSGENPDPDKPKDDPKKPGTDTDPDAGNGNGASSPDQELNAAGEVVFRIAAGTGNNPWNTPENPILIKPGQVLRIYNDDSAQHTIHTNSQRGGLPVHGCGNFFNTRNIGNNGIACRFGNNISANLIGPDGMLDDNEIHDHFTWSRGSGRGMVYIKVIQ